MATTTTEIDVKNLASSTTPPKGGKVLIRTDADGLKQYDYDSLMQAFLNKIYPIGSIYISVGSANPSTFLSGTWTRVAGNMTLWGSADGSGLGSTKSAGLPNLVGNFMGHLPGIMYSGLTGDGKLFTEGAYGRPSNVGPTTSAGKEANRDLTFNAQKYNSIYGNSTTVQPPALVVNIWKRTA